MPFHSESTYTPKNRDRFYLSYVFLKIIEAKEDDDIGATKTHLMYKSFTSHEEIKVHLKRLLDNGLISLQRTGNKQLYSLTEKGTKYINLMHEFIELMPHQFAKDFEQSS